MAFQNRQAQYLNRKKLIVKDIVKDSSGNIVSLTVDVERAEGNVSVQGTPLTAENLNAEIKAAVNSLLSSSSPTAETQNSYDQSNKVATTEFVWSVLEGLGYDRPANSGSSNNGSTNSGTSGGSGGSSSSGSSGT